MGIQPEEKINTHQAVGQAESGINAARPPSKHGKARLRNALLALTALLGVTASYLWLRPIRSGRFSEQSHSVLTYAEAVRGVETLDGDERSALADYGKTILLTHGRKTDRAIVFLHGYTSSPGQFAQLGQLFYARGYNVLIPRLPHHGFKDRLTNALTQLTAEELTLQTDHVLDIAHGLGSHVTLAGLSAGGVLAAWAAQHRSDLDSVVLIDPSFSYKSIPEFMVRPVMNLSLTLPDSFLWWDNKAKENGHTAYSYPRYSKRALAELLRLGLVLQDRATQRPPAAKSVLVITNGNDGAVDNHMTTRVLDDWRHAGALNIHTFEFPKSYELDHDMINPTQPKQNIKAVYPKLLELIDKI